MKSLHAHTHRLCTRHTVHMGDSWVCVCVCVCDYETYPWGFDCLGVLRADSKREVRSFIVRFCLPLSFTLGQTFTSREQTTGGQPAVNTHTRTCTNTRHGKVCMYAWSLSITSIWSNQKVHRNGRNLINHNMRFWESLHWCRKVKKKKRLIWTFYFKNWCFQNHLWF